MNFKDDSTETWEGRTMALDLFSRKLEKYTRVYSGPWKWAMVSIAVGYGAQMTRRMVASEGTDME